MWEQLDRAFAYKIPDGQRAKNGMLAMAERLELHLGMVFHRFLSGEARRKRKLVITINGTSVEPWDPFCRDEKRTKALKPLELELETQVGSGVVRFTPFVLPARSQFSSEQTFTKASGPSKWNRQQGFYIYREDRLIQSGGWSGLRTSDEHTKLARAAIDFRRGLDAAFAINVAKMRVNLPGALREQLERPIAELVRLAQEQYRKGGVGPGPTVTPQPPPKPVDPRPGRPPSPSPVTPTGTGPGTPPPPKEPPHTVDPPTELGQENPSVREALEEVARKLGESETLRRITTTLRSEHPRIARALGY
jgi:hypothetical protein